MMPGSILTFDLSSSFTLSSAIESNSGTGGGVVKTGSAILTFSGTNTYVGGTTFNQGILSIGADNNLGVASGGLTFNGGTLQSTGTFTSARTVSLSGLGTIDVTSGNALTMSGAFSGAGSLTKANSGTLILEGTNTYNGSTTVNGGILRTGSANALPTNSMISLANVSGAILDLNNFSKVIVSLSGGGTTGGNVMLGSGTLTVGDASSTNYGGIISGSSGALIKQGAGTLTLAGANTYTGPTTVAAGRLAVNGSLFTGPVTVNSGGTLGGTGVVQGSTTIQNGGILNPGNSIGTITVDSVTFDNGSTFSIEINPSTSSKIVTTGAGGATITPGAILLVTERPGDYEAGNVYTILESQAPGTISNGTSFTIVSVGPEHQFTLSQDPTNHFLFLILANHVPIILPTNGLTGNRLIMANYLNSIRSFAPLEPVYDQLALLFEPETALSSEELDQALDLISPARNAFSTFASQTNAFAFNDIIESRIANRRLTRAAGRGNNSQPELVGLLVDAKDSIYPPYNEESTNSCECVEGQWKQQCARFSFWAAPFGEFGHEKSQEQTPAFDLQTGGILLGFDAFDFNHALLGFSIGYAYLNIDEDDHFGKAWLNNYVASLYSSFFSSNFYLDLAVWGGYHQTHNQRNIFFQSFNATASSETHGWQVVPHLEVGYDIFFGCVALEPFARMDWAVNFEDDFIEHGASPLNMQQDSHTSSLLRSEVGLACYQTRHLASGGLFIARESLSYVNKKPFQNNGQVTAAIVGAPGGTFTVETLTSTQNLVAPGIEFFYRSKNGVFLSADYEGEFSGRFWSNTFIVKAGKEF